MATKSPEIFGRAGAPGVDVNLPYYLRAGRPLFRCSQIRTVMTNNLFSADGRAVVKIDSDGRTAISSWYEIWEAVNAVAYMCITPAAKSGGRATKIGM